MVLFWDEDVACPPETSTGFWKKLNENAESWKYNEFEKAAEFPRLCSSAEDKSASQNTTTGNTPKLLESSYIRSKTTTSKNVSNIVPQDYVFLTYTQSDADNSGKAWLVDPAPLPMSGVELLKGIAESVRINPCLHVSGDSTCTYACVRSRVFMTTQVHDKSR